MVEFKRLQTLLSLSMALSYFTCPGSSNRILIPNRRLAEPVVVRMPEISSEDIQNAFEMSQTQIETRCSIEGIPELSDMIVGDEPDSDFHNSASARHQLGGEMKQEAFELQKAQRVNERAFEILAKKYDLTREQISYGLPSLLERKSFLENREFGKCIPRPEINCTASIFRTIDGSCNNLANPTWGKSFSCYDHILQPLYHNGISSPRRSVVNDQELPSPRLISRAIHSESSSKSTQLTAMTMQIGEFLGHDMMHTPSSKTENNTIIQCCSNTTNVHPDCFPISIPINDSFYSNFGQRCMNFVRSSSCTECPATGTRRQTNQVTPYIDLSPVYGATDHVSRALRSMRGGRMKSSFPRNRNELLPTSETVGKCVKDDPFNFCFVTGSDRSNVQPDLTVMHTLWLRHHNRICKEIRTRDTSLNDEQIYSITRRIAMAQFQMIVYKEFLPAVIGPHYMDRFHLNPLENGYTAYDPNSKGTILSEFSTACFRFGHTSVANKMQLYRAQGNQPENFALKDHFFLTFALMRGDYDPMMKGLFRQPLEAYDRHVVGAVTNHLYQKPGDHFGLDLVAINLQRGLDHGIQPYTSYMKHMFDVRISTFEDLQMVMNREMVSKLKKIYPSVDDIDLYTGGLSERSLPDAYVGPSFAAIIAEQFRKLKFSDRHYFEHGNMITSFTKKQLKEIRSITLSRIIAANSDRPLKIQKNCFRKEDVYENEVFDSNRLLAFNYSLFTPKAEKIERENKP